MTPTDEAHFITLWNEGLDTAAIAQRLGIPVGTVYSRAHRLQALGKIQPRPKGGAYPRSKALTRGKQPGVSGDTPQGPERASTRVSADTPPVQYLPPNQGEMLPLLHDILQELRQLTGGLAARVSIDTPGVPRDTLRVSDGVSGRVSARTPLPTERGKSVRWNLHLSAQVRARVKGLAGARGLQDSQMVEELLWLALSVVEATPRQEP